MSVEFHGESPAKFDSRTLSRETLNRWTGRKSTHLHLRYYYIMIICLLLITTTTTTATTTTTNNNTTTNTNTKTNTSANTAIIDERE